MEQNMERIIKMLQSNNIEDVKLGLEICKAKFPFLYSALLDIKIPTTGLRHDPLLPLDQAFKKLNENLHLFNIGPGSIVKYKGLPNVPEMVVVDISMETSKKTYFNTILIKIECTYFNKSKQAFSSVTDRIECFEIVNKN